MKFCKCGAIMVPSGSELVCRACGHKESASDVKAFREIKKEKVKSADTQMQDIDTMPTMKVKCPKCGHPEAHFWTAQTRGGDEAETQFFRCKKCGHSWRKY